MRIKSVLGNLQWCIYPRFPFRFAIIYFQCGYCNVLFKSNINKLNGGAGNLLGTFDNIGARIQREESFQQEAQTIQKKAGSFTELAEQVDKQVIAISDKNKNEL